MGFLDAAAKIANPVSSLIGGGLNIVGSAIDYQNQKALMEKQYAYQQQLQEQQNQFNLDMWNRNNEYNSPSHQRELYENAGFNPMLMMSGGSSGSQLQSASSVSVPSAPNPTASFGDVGRTFIDLEEALSRIRKNDSEAGLSEAQRLTEEALRDWKVKLQESTINLNESQRKEHDQRVNNLKSEQAYTDALKDKTEEEKLLIAEQVKYYPLLSDAQLRQYNAHIEELLSQAKLNNRQREYLYSLMQVANSQIELNRELAHKAHREADLVDSQEDLNRSLAGESDARTGNIEEDTRSKSLSNDVREETKATEIFQANVQNTLGTALDMVDQGVSIIGKKGMMKAVTSNASSNERNARSNERNATVNEHREQRQAAAAAKRQQSRKQNHRYNRRR